VKIIFVTIAALILMFALCACEQTQQAQSEPAESTVTPIPIGINKTTENTTTGKSVSLSVSGTDSTVAWSSSDPYIAKVDETGLVTGGYKGGVAVVTAKFSGEKAICTVTNSVIMRDITSSELVSEMTIGADWNDKITLRDPNRVFGEFPSAPLSITFTIWDQDEDALIFAEGTQMVLGDKRSQKIALPKIDRSIASKTLSHAVINFRYAGDVEEEQDIVFKVDNARLSVGKKVYQLDYLNGTHTISMKAEQNQGNGLWFCCAAIGDGVESGLPTLGELANGVFQADMELVVMKSDFAALQESLSAAAGGDIPINEEMIEDAAQAGFDVLRIPFSFTPFLNEDFVLRKEYLDELELVVNRGLNQGMYCIIDADDYLDYSWVGDKWEKEWMSEQYVDYVDSRYTAAWKQIAERFKDYDDHLIFGSFNEPNGGDGLDNDVHYEGSRFAPSANELKRLNELTKLFVETVSATGGNNNKRHLYVAAWMAGWEANLLINFELPDYDRLIASVHYYYYDESGNDRLRKSWSSSNPAMAGQVDLMFGNLKTYYLDRGIPVIMTEFGTQESMVMEDRIDQATYILDKASKIGIPCVWFEGAGWYEYEDGDSFALYDRKKMEWHYPALLDAIIGKAKSSK